jgi:hypothetical protein
VNTIGSATASNDYETVVNYTHPKVIAEAGSREVLLKAMDLVMTSTKAKGAKIVSSRVSGDVKLYQVPGARYAVVPTETIIDLSGRRVKGLGSQIGHQPSSEKRWTYVSSNKLQGRKLRKMFPDFPKGAEPLPLQTILIN